MPAGSPYMVVYGLPARILRQHPGMSRPYVAKHVFCSMFFIADNLAV